jgi:midasin (ATPase involved in ribosome maturation)
MEYLVEMHEEEVFSTEPFKFNPEPEPRELDSDLAGKDELDDSVYTPGETEFADGEGARLDQEIENPDNDQQDEERDAELGHS